MTYVVHNSLKIQIVHCRTKTSKARRGEMGLLAKMNFTTSIKSQNDVILMKLLIKQLDAQMKTR